MPKYFFFIKKLLCNFSKNRRFFEYRAFAFLFVDFFDKIWYDDTIKYRWGNQYGKK